MSQSECILSMANDYNDGNLWLFYVYLIANWLPTNYRRAKISQQFNRACECCTGNRLETFNHFLQCPALEKEREESRQTCLYYLGRAFEKVTVEDPLNSHMERLLNFLEKFICDPRASLSANSLVLTKEKLRQLAKLFVEAN